MRGEREWRDGHAKMIATNPRLLPPYVSAGAMGCRLSAQIVRDEMRDLMEGHPDRERLEEQAQAWEYRAEVAAQKERAA